MSSYRYLGSRTNFRPRDPPRFLYRQSACTLLHPSSRLITKRQLSRPKVVTTYSFKYRFVHTLRHSAIPLQYNSIQQLRPPRDKLGQTQQQEDVSAAPSILGPISRSPFFPPFIPRSPHVIPGRRPDRHAVAWTWAHSGGNGVAESRKRGYIGTVRQVATGRTRRPRYMRRTGSDVQKWH